MTNLLDRRTLLAGLAAGFAAAARADGQTPPHARNLKELVADAERSFAASMAMRDLTAFAALVSQEAVFFGGADGNTALRGRAGIVDGWKRYFDGPAPFSWTPDSTEVLDSGTLGATSGPVRNAHGIQTGRFNSIWRLESDGAWRVIFDRGCQVCR